MRIKKLLSMSFLLMNALIAIGNRDYDTVNSFTIKSDVKEFGDSARIVMPRNYSNLAGERITATVQASMPVSIAYGYNGNIKQEFAGYVAAGVSAAEFPLEINCDQVYRLKQNNHVLSYRAVQLKKLLSDIAPTYEIEGVDFDLGKVAFNNKSTYQILSWIKKQYGMYTTLRDGVLHCGFSYQFKPGDTQEHEYIIGENVKDYSSLKFETDRGFNTRVEIDVMQKDGKKKIYKFGAEGEDATVKKIVMPGVSGETAQARAESLYRQYTYDGYTGTIVGMGEPRVKAGDSLKITDKANPRREGVYLVESVEVVFEESHIERHCKISYKID
jgi:hypothetical protein